MQITRKYQASSNKKEHEETRRMVRESERMSETPGYVGIESRHRRVKTLVSANEGIFLDLPDLTMLVPGLQVGLQVSGIGRHTCSYC